MSRYLPPFSFSMADSTFERNPGWIKTIYTRYSTGKAFRIDCISESTAKILEKYTNGDNLHKTRIAHCSFTDYSKATKKDFRDIDVISISRFVEGKGHELIEEISNDISNLNVYICGFGPRKPNIPMANIIQINDPFDFLSRSKIFLSLQKINNYPSQSLLEAMACECAIIATDVGETRKILDERCAVLIPYESEALKKSISYLISHDREAAELGKRARERVLRDHTIERYLDYFKKEIIKHSL